MCGGPIRATLLALLLASTGFAADEDHLFKQGSLATQADRDALVGLVNLPGSVSFRFNFVSPDTFRDPVRDDLENAPAEKLSSRIAELKKKLAADGSDFTVLGDLAFAYSKQGNRDLAYRHIVEAAALLEKRIPSARPASEQIRLGKILTGLYLSLLASFQDMVEDRNRLCDRTYELCTDLVRKEKSVETLGMTAAFYFFVGDVPRSGDAAAEAYRVDPNNFDALSLCLIIDYFKIFGGDVESVKTGLAGPVTEFLSKKPLYAELARHIARTENAPGARRRYESLQVFVWFSYLSLKAYLLDSDSLTDFKKPLPHFTRSDYELVKKTGTLLADLTAQGYFMKEDGLAWAGMLAMVNGDIESAVSSYEKRFYLEPSSDSLDILVYLLAHKMKNYPRAHALVDYRMARGKEANDFILKGSIFFFEKRFDEAASCMERALALDPGNGAAKLDLAIIDLNRNRLEAAGSLFGELDRVEGFEFRDRLLAAMAVRELLLGRHLDALARLKNALRDNPASEPAGKILNRHFTAVKKSP